MSSSNGSDTPTNNASGDVSGQTRSALSNLQTLRDQIRVRIHLGGMELKDLWNELEAKIFEAEKKVEHAASDAMAWLQTLTPQVEELGKKLTRSESTTGQNKDKDEAAQRA